MLRSDLRSGFSGRRGNVISLKVIDLDSIISCLVFTNVREESGEVS